MVLVDLRYNCKSDSPEFPTRVVENEIFLLLMLVGIFAGFVDSAVGGGGLLRLPAMLAAGLPPHIALGRISSHRRRQQQLQVQNISKVRLFLESPH